MAEQPRTAPKRIDDALRADDSGQLDAIVRTARPEDRAVLRAVALGEAIVDAPNSRVKALYALGRWADPTLPEIVEHIRPTLDERGRIAAVDALGRLGGQPALGIVLRYVQDDSEQVRKTVVKALARIGGDRADTALGRIAETDPAPWIRSVAQSATRTGR